METQIKKQIKHFAWENQVLGAWKEGSNHLGERKMLAVQQHPRNRERSMQTNAMECPGTLMATEQPQSMNRRDLLPNLPNQQ